MRFQARKTTGGEKRIPGPDMAYAGGRFCVDAVGVVLLALGGILMNETRGGGEDSEAEG